MLVVIRATTAIVMPCNNVLLAASVFGCCCCAASKICVEFRESNACACARINAPPLPTLHALTPSFHEYLNPFERGPHIPNQEPSVAQQLRLPVSAHVPQFAHALFDAL